MRLLFLGDIVGRPARKLLGERLKKIIREEKLDFVIANAENSASGSGITRKVAQELFDCGIDVLTLGDHAYRKKDIFSALNALNIVRPLNISRRAVGRGYFIKEHNGVRIAIVNLIGRVFMGPSDNPFDAIEQILPLLKEQTNIIIVDFHAEATSEKKAMGSFLAEKVTAVLGTHTHVPTADETILKSCTAYITDVGMCGSCDSIIGRRKEPIIEHFTTGMPSKFDLAEGDVRLQGVILEVDKNTGRSISIKRVEYT